MGLLFAESAGGGDFQAKSETALLHQLGCKVCPLSTEPGRMPATGATRPLAYILGEAPGRQEIEQGEQFVGAAGTLLRQYIPEAFLGKLRWNNVVRSRTPKNRTPERTEIECCRPSVVLDIEQSKPKAIFGFGNVPLNWVSGFSGITYWRGRRMPAKIGSHVCWYYPMLHPSYLARIARNNGDDYGSEDERAFAFDLERAFADLEALPAPVVHTPEDALANVECVTDIRLIEKALAWASRQPLVGLDYETNRLRPYASGAKILTAAVGTLERAYAFPIEHPGAGYSSQQVAEVKSLWKRFLERAPCEKAVHNLAFEHEWSGYFFGTEVLRARKWQDTANAAAIVDERKGKTKPGCFSLEFLVQQYFGFNLKKVSNVDRSKLETTPLPTVLKYNAMDAKYHAGLWFKLWDEIRDGGLEEAYALAVRRVPTVVLSQLKGVPVDQARVKVLSKKYEALIAGAEQAIAALQVVKDYQRKKGKEFNPYSPQDVLYVLDDMLGCPEVHVVDKYSKEKKRSTDETVLTQIEHPIAKLLMKLREASGTKSKYIDSLDKDAETTTIWPDGLPHCNFNTYFAETGRLSCDVPNLQNFPKRDSETKEVRSSVRAPTEHVVLTFDYGQIEARVIAMFTKDKRFCKALWERYDVHFDWAERLAYEYPARVGGKKFLKDKKVMKDFRTDVKNQFTFPLFFGAKDTSVAGYLKMPISVIRSQIRAFWKEFSGVKTWQEELMKSYQENGYVTCLTGRKRRAPLSTNQVYNSPIQGTAAEIVMDAMCRLSETGDPRLQPEINIHDDFTFLRVPKAEVDTIAEKVIGMMLAVPFPWVNVPITIEMSVGTNWAELEEIGTYSSDQWGK